MLENYTYILQNKNDSLLTFYEYDDVYKTILLRYHYPVCLDVTLNLDETEKDGIKMDEYSFIKSKLPENIQIYQLPRLLYDLFFILYNCVYLYDTKFETKSFNNESMQYNGYCNDVQKIHNDLSEKIFNLNNYIVEFLKNLKGVNYKNPKYKDYNKILDSIIKEYYFFINETMVKKKLEYYDTQHNFFNSFVTDNLFDINDCLSRPVCNFNTVFKKLKISYKDTIFVKEIFLSIIESLSDDFKKIANEPVRKKYIERTTKITETINDPIKVRKIISEHKNAFDSNDYFKIFVKDLNINLLKNTLIQETINYERNKIILYRGARDSKEFGIDSNVPNRGYSISYNSSLLNGLLTDITACTYKFMTDENIVGNVSKDIKPDKTYKHKYMLNKFLYGDNSVEDNLFFIPPLHPYLQMMSKGELWHPRSKIYNGSNIKEISTFAGLYDNITGVVGESKRFPDYLSSNYQRDVFDTEFKRFIDNNRSRIHDDIGDVTEDSENEYIVFYDAKNFDAGGKQSRKKKVGKKRVGKKRKTVSKLRRRFK
jgi:hypothetical protein